MLKKGFEEFAILLFIESGEGSVEKWGKFPKFDLMFQPKSVALKSQFVKFFHIFVFFFPFKTLTQRAFFLVCTSRLRRKIDKYNGKRNRERK